MSYPQGQLVSAPLTNGFAGADFGTHISYLGAGGYRELPTLADRDAIPVKTVLEYDGLGSGMRRAMMVVAVAATEQAYILYIPGYFDLPDAQRLSALQDNANWVVLGLFLNPKIGNPATALSADEVAAIQAANSPSATNSFVTTQDLTAALNGKVVDSIYPPSTDKVPTTNAVATAINSKADLVGGKVPAAQLPSYVDDVLEYPTLGDLPQPGETGKIYVLTAAGATQNKEYRWSGSQYVELVKSPGSTDVVPEGSLNLYFTPARAQAAVQAAQDTQDAAITANTTALAALNREVVRWDLETAKVAPSSSASSTPLSYQGGSAFRLSTPAGNQGTFSLLSAQGSPPPTGTRIGFRVGPADNAATVTDQAVRFGKAGGPTQLVVQPGEAYELILAIEPTNGQYFWQYVVRPTSAATIDQSNLVHKTGDETLAGKKTFTSDVAVQHGGTTLTVYNGGSQAGLYYNNGTQFGFVKFENVVDEDTDQVTGVVASVVADSLGVFSHLNERRVVLSEYGIRFQTGNDPDSAATILFNEGTGTYQLHNFDFSNVSGFGGSSGPANTDALPEGTTNKYYTDARAQSALSSQLAAKADLSSGKVPLSELPYKAGTNVTIAADGTISATGGPASSGPANTDALPEGGTNLYYTDARALAAKLAGYAKSTAQRPLATTDTLAQGLGIIEGRVDANTSNLNNLVGSLALKAPLASPAFTGLPTGPTAALHDSSQQLATTAYVQIELQSRRIVSLGSFKTDGTGFGCVFQSTGSAAVVCEVMNDYFQGNNSGRVPAVGSFFFLRQGTAGAAWNLTASTSYASNGGGTVLVYHNCTASTSSQYDTLRLEKIAANTWLVSPVEGTGAATNGTGGGFTPVTSGDGTKFLNDKGQYAVPVAGASTGPPQQQLLTTVSFTDQYIGGGNFTQFVNSHITYELIHCWDETTHKFTAPSTGAYRFDMNTRIYDGTAAGVQYGMGVSKVAQDEAEFGWRATSSALRQGGIHTRTMFLSAGDTVLYYTYCDGNVHFANAALTISYA